MMVKDFCLFQPNIKVNLCSLTFEYRWVTVFHKKARMRVPKFAIS